MIPGPEDLRFGADQRALIVKVRRFKNDQLEPKGKLHVILDGPKSVGSLWFDRETDNQPKDTSDQSKRCVVVGMRNDMTKDPKKTYYILVVLEGPRVNEYKRLGVGKVQACYVSKESKAGTLV